MKDFILICTTLAMFVFGYYITRKVDTLLEKNTEMIEKEQLNKKHLIKIAAETPMLLNSVAAALEYCVDANSNIEFAVSSGRSGKLLHNLSDGVTDLVLLTEDSAAETNPDFEYIRIPFCQGSEAAEAFGLKVQNLYEDKTVYVLWNKDISSPLRDWFVLALRNDYCVSRCS